MKINKEELTIKESKELIFLGIPEDKASMIRIDEVTGNWESVFTFFDLLRLLPNKLDTGKGYSSGFQLNEGSDNIATGEFEELWFAYYDEIWEDGEYPNDPEPINAVYKLIIKLIKYEKL